MFTLDKTVGFPVWWHKNSDVSSMPRKNREDTARRGTLTQFNQRGAIGQAKIYKYKQYMQRIEELFQQKHHFSAKEFMRKINKEMHTSILDRFQNNQVLRAMPLRNNLKDTLRCIIFGIWRWWPKGLTFCQGEN